MKIKEASGMKMAANFVLFVVAVIALSDIHGHADSKGEAQDSFNKFITEKSSAAWEAFIKDVRVGRYGPSDALLPQVMEYHDAGEHRDLPNSMALKDISPNEYVEFQSARADKALATIRLEESSDLWRLLIAMATQAFEDELVWTACEIAARISPYKFEEMAVEVKKAVPANAWITERLRERWLPAK